MISITKRLVILAGLVGILFYTSSMDQLIAWIADYELSWYKLGVPLAWGVILGGLLALLKLNFLEQWLEPVTVAGLMLLTCGLTGTAAVAAKHQLLPLILPTLQIATIGLGLYLFAYAFARFLGAERQRRKDKQNTSS